MFMLFREEQVRKEDKRPTNKVIELELILKNVSNQSNMYFVDGQMQPHQMNVTEIIPETVAKSNYHPMEGIHYFF